MEAEEEAEGDPFLVVVVDAQFPAVVVGEPHPARGADRIPAVQEVPDGGLSATPEDQAPEIQGDYLYPDRNTAIQERGDSGRSRDYVL